MTSDKDWESAGIRLVSFISLGRAGLTWDY